MEVEFASQAGLGWRGKHTCLLYTSDAADERSSVDLGGRRIIKKKQQTEPHAHRSTRHEETHTSRAHIVSIA